MNMDMYIFNKSRSKLYDWLIDFWLLLLLLHWWKGKERKIFVFTRLDGGVILSVARVYVSSTPNLSNFSGVWIYDKRHPSITKTMNVVYPVFIYIYTHTYIGHYLPVPNRIDYVKLEAIPSSFSLLPQQQRQTTVTIISLVERRDTVDCCCCCCVV